MSILKMIIDATEYLGKKPKLVKCLLKETREILRKEKIDCMVEIRKGVWSSFYHPKKKLIQYGENMILGILNGNIQAQRYYYCFLLE